MARFKRPISITRSEGPFFSRQLAGETPLSTETARLLCQQARVIWTHQPWSLVTEGCLIVVRRPEWPEAAYVSIMGMRGEHFSVCAYLGAQGLAFFQQLQEAASVAASMDAGEFIAEMPAIYVSWENRRLLTNLDKELIESVKTRPEPGALWPQFRASRRRYHPWYPNEQEGRMLLDCMDAVIWLWEREVPPEEEAWDTQDIYPELVRDSDDGGFDLHRAPIGKRHVPEPVPPIDESRVNRILLAGQRPEGAIEVDRFYSMTRIGGPNDRPLTARIAMAVDQDSGYAFPPRLEPAAITDAEMLVDAVLTAMEAGSRPRRVFVRRKEYVPLLKPLGAALKFEVADLPALPALDSAKRSMLAMMGDREPIPFR